jgi:lysophospholipase L1-like esterase
VTLRLALLGDSIAYGIGASSPDDALAPRLVRALAEQGFAVATRVVAVPGARSGGLRKQVDVLLPWAPDVAVVVIGANDLTHQTPVETAAAKLGEAVRRLRAAGADVVLAPAPDLSVVPHVPVAMRPLVRLASDRLRAAQVQAMQEHGGRIADAGSTTSASFAADASLFSADRFHPSSAGYRVIADALAPEVLRAARVAASARAG